MSLNCSKAVLVCLVSFIIIQAAIAKGPTTTAGVNATDGQTDSPPTGVPGKGGRGPRGNGDDDNSDDDDHEDGAARKPIKIDTYNAFNFYGQGRAVELIRRMARRLAERNDRRDGEDMEIEGEDEEDKEMKDLIRYGRGFVSACRFPDVDHQISRLFSLDLNCDEEENRTSYEEFPDEALELPEAKRSNFEYGQVPFSPNLRRRPQPWANPFQGPDFPANPWGGGQRGGFPIIPMSPLGILLFGPRGGAGPGLQPPYYYDEEEDRKGKKKKKKDRKRDDNDDGDDDDVPLDWTNLCIYECGEGVPNGHHRKCDDCAMYFMCVDGRGSAKHCDSLNFNHVTDQCDVASSVACDDVEFAGFPKTTSPASMTSPQSETSPWPRPLRERLEEEGPFCVENCWGVPDGTYPSCRRCRKFTKCWWGSAWSLSCREGEFFDPKFEMCRPEDQVECREEKVGGKEEVETTAGTPPRNSTMEY